MYICVLKCFAHIFDTPRYVFVLARRFREASFGVLPDLPNFKGAGEVEAAVDHGLGREVALAPQAVDDGLDAGALNIAYQVSGEVNPAH